MTKRDLVRSYLQSHEVTLVCTFSRLAMVKPFFEALDKMDLPRKQIHLIIFDNSDILLLNQALEMEAQRQCGKFLSVLHHISGREGGRTLLGQSNDSWKKSKLKPIYQMWVDICKMIKTEIFFQLEDDTIAPPDSFYKLMETLLAEENAGFVTAIETGRNVFPWSKVRLGVHNIKRKGRRILERISFHPSTAGVKKIDSAGVYCFVAYTDLWKDAFKGYGKYVEEVPFFAMDNMLTNNIKQQGHELYADFSVWCDHLQQTGGELLHFNKKQAVQMIDFWVPEYEQYAQCIEIKNFSRKTLH